MVPAYAGTIRTGMGARGLSSGRRPPPLEILDILSIPERNGLDYYMKEISRRTFLKLAGVSAAAAALYQSSGSILAALNVIDQETPLGEERWVPSVCQLCPAECGLRVRVVGGLAVKIEGNPLHPLNQGKPCPRAQAALQVLLVWAASLRGTPSRIGQVRI